MSKNGRLIGGRFILDMYILNVMELDFTSDTIEVLLAKRMLTDKNWMNIMQKVYDSRWFKTPAAREFINILLKYYEKYDKTMNVQTARATFEKLLQRPNVDINPADAARFIDSVFEQDD